MKTALNVGLVLLAPSLCVAQYFTIDSKVNQADAAALCEAEGGLIASFHNDVDYAEARTLCMNLCNTQDSSNGDCGCWTGIKDDGTENIWYNEDGSAADYLLNADGSPKTGTYPWWSGEPNDWGSGEDCVHIWRPQSYYLNDIACSDLNYVMCEATTVPNYFAITTQLSEAAAETACEAQGGMLASFRNDVDFAAGQSLCIDTCAALDGSNGDCGCWIGLKDDGTENIWYNVDGTGPDYMLEADGSPKTGIYPWWSGEPNDWGSGEDCVHIWKPQSFYLNDIACTDSNFAICDTIGETTTEFFALTTKMTQSAASAECETQGGKITSFHSDAEYATASTLCQSVCETYDSSNGACGCWTGLKDDTTEDIWYNEDGTQKDYLMSTGGYPFTGVYPWHSGEPNDWGSGEDCVHIWRAQGYDLNDISCSTSYYAICRKEVAVTTTTTTTTTTTSEPSGKEAKSPKEPKAPKEGDVEDAEMNVLFAGYLTNDQQPSTMMWIVAASILIVAFALIWSFYSNVDSHAYQKIPDCAAEEGTGDFQC